MMWFATIVVAGAALLLTLATGEMGAKRDTSLWSKYWALLIYIVVWCVAGYLLLKAAS